jgi:hypothetical protein
VEGLADCTEVAPLEIACSPDGAAVQIEGEQFQSEASCPFSEDVAAGDYEIEISAEGYQPWSEQINVVPVDGARVEVELEEAMVVEELDHEVDGVHWSTPVSYGAIGAGVLMLAGGGFMDYRAGNRATQIAEARDEDDLARVEELEGAAGSARFANIGLYAGGGLLLVGGVALFLIDFSPSEDVDGRVSLGLTPRGISATLTW